MKHLKSKHQNQAWNIKFQTKTKTKTKSKRFHLNFTYKSQTFSSFFNLRSYNSYFSLLFTSSTKPTIKSRFFLFFRKVIPNKSKNVPNKSVENSLIAPKKSAETTPIITKKSARNSPSIPKNSPGNSPIVPRKSAVNPPNDISNRKAVNLQPGNILWVVGVFLAVMLVYLFRHYLSKIMNINIDDAGVAKLVDNLLDYAVSSIHYNSQSFLQEYSLEP